MKSEHASETWTPLGLLVIFVKHPRFHVFTTAKVLRISSWKILVRLQWEMVFNPKTLRRNEVWWRLSTPAIRVKIQHSCTELVTTELGPRFFCRLCIIVHHKDLRWTKKSLTSNKLYYRKNVASVASKCFVYVNYCAWNLVIYLDTMSSS